MNFYLFPNSKKDNDFNATKAIIKYLKVHNATVLIDEKYSESKLSAMEQQVQFLPEGECIKRADIAIVIGGDGTILKAANALYGTQIPIIGINLGKVGYMAELEINECELMDVLFDKTDSQPNFHIDERMMLECTVERANDTVFTGVCLNEAVVAKGDIARMIDIDLIHNGNVIASYQCDGVIASTPTGSTAYSMSAGGAVIDPGIECISVLPLCAYLCINSSPIIFSKNAKITLVYRCVRDNTAYLSIDGNESFKLCDNDKITITAAKHPTKLARFKNTDFYQLLNTKLSNRTSELAKKS